MTAVLLDIEGAFNHTSEESICKGSREHDAEQQEGGGGMEETREVWVGKGCPR